MAEDAFTSRTPVSDESTFRVLFELGRGGMAHAELALASGPQGFERLVVLKRLKRELAGDERALARFMTEARLAACIHHANVVATHHVASDDRGPFLVVDYVEGSSVEELVDRCMLRGAPMPAPIAMRIALDVLSGLAAIHGACDSRGRPLSILHRDVSPQNILVGRDGVARLLDFGVARSGAGQALTDEGHVVGKLLYMPPEYLRREPVGPAMDVYGLGVTIWSALAGRQPWPDASEAQVVRAIVEEGVPALADEADVTPRLAELVQRACARRVEERFDSARAMADELETLARETGWMATHGDVARWLEALQGRDLAHRRAHIARLLESRALRASAEDVTAPTGELVRRGGRRRWLLWAAPAVALITIAALATMAWPGRGAPPQPATSSKSSGSGPEPPRSVPLTGAPTAASATSGNAPPSASRAPAPAPPAPRSTRTATPDQGPTAPDEIVDRNPYQRRKR